MQLGGRAREGPWKTLQQIANQCGEIFYREEIALRLSKLRQYMRMDLNNGVVRGDWRLFRKRGDIDAGQGSLLCPLVCPLVAQPKDLCRSMHITRPGLIVDLASRLRLGHPGQQPAPCRAAFRAGSRTKLPGLNSRATCRTANYRQLSTGNSQTSRRTDIGSSAVAHSVYGHYTRCANGKRPELRPVPQYIFISAPAEPGKADAR